MPTGGMMAQLSTLSFYIVRMGEFFHGRITFPIIKRRIGQQSPRNGPKKETLMRKSTLFVSAAVTAFMLAVLFGVVSAYQNTTRIAAQPSPLTEVAQVVVSVPAQASTPTSLPPLPTPAISAEQAADIASKVMGKTDLYSVELTQFEGVDAYLVTFSSGDLVYVGLDGQILSISKLPVTVVTVSNNGNGGGGGGGGGGDGNENHESGDDHEESEEHEGGDD